MIAGKLSQEDIKIKSELLRLLEERKQVYNAALVETALIKDDKGSWRNGVTKITLEEKDSGVLESLNYGNVILSKISITIQELIKMIDDLVDKGIFSVKNCPEISAEGNFRSPSINEGYLSSNNEFNIGWPANYLEFGITPSLNLNSRPLISSKYPLFPDIQSAIKSHLGLDVMNRSYYGNILFFLPKYQVKIGKLVIREKNIKFEAILNGLSEDRIIGKIYCEAEGRSENKDFNVTQTTTIELGFKPSWILLYLLSKDDGSILDFRRAYTTWPSHMLRDIDFEIKQEDTIELFLENGENQKVEFKRELNKQHDEFIESAVSFSNGGGGVIFIGVDDNGKPVRFSSDGIEETIVSILRSNCDPPIEPSIRKIEINDTPIVLVEIKEGKDKPYVYRNKGVYVRRGSTDRIATRDELDEFYRDKNRYGGRIGYL